MPFLSANGIDLHYQDIGDGEPLMMIAGYASDSTSWTPVSLRLRRQRRLILPDNRASGQTQSGDGPIKISDYAEDCIALMDHLGLEQIDIVGHSMGGVIAMELASRWPERVRKLILVSATPAGNAHSRAVLENITALREAGIRDADWLRNFFTWIFDRTLFADEKRLERAIAIAASYAHKQSADDLRRQCDALRGVDLTPQLAKINAKIRLIAGENDLLAPPDEMRAAFADLQDVNLEVIENAAHSVHFDQPQPFISAILAFLDD